MNRIGSVRMELSVRYEPILSDPCHPERSEGSAVIEPGIRGAADFGGWFPGIFGRAPL